MSLLGRAAAVITRCQRDYLDLVRFEAPQVTVLDQVVGVLVVASEADVNADVVEQGGVFQPLAFALAEPVGGLGLVEQ